MTNSVVVTAFLHWELRNCSRASQTLMLGTQPAQGLCDGYIDMCLSAPARVGRSQGL